MIRPSERAIALVLALTGLSVLVAVFLPEGARLVGPIWAAVAGLGLIDLFLSVPARSLTLAAQLPEKGYNGSKVMLDIRVTGRRLPKEPILFVDHDPGLEERAEAGQTRLTLTEGGALRILIAYHLAARGRQEIREIALAYRSRLGLFQLVRRAAPALAIRSLPDAGPILSGEIQAQMLPLTEGARATRLRGEGSEFHQLREFVPGMDLRSVDWKRSARFRQMIARETRAERNHQIILCLDTGHLMAERLGALSRLDHAINAVLALAWAAGLGGDQVGLYAFAARPGSFLPPQTGRKAFAGVQAAVTDLVQSDHESNHTLGLSTLGGQLRRRSLVVVFSDFADTTSAELMMENLAVLGRQHLVLYVTLTDPVLAGASTLDPKGRGLHGLAEALTARQMVQERQLVLDRLRRLGVLCLDTPPAGLTSALINRYIEIKSKEMI